MTSQDNAGEVVERYLAKCREMGDAGDGARYQWWDDLEALITSLVSERDAQPQFDGLPKRKLDDLLARGWQVSGYAIQKDGEHGLVTTGGFVGWFTTAQNAALTAERHLAEARGHIEQMSELLKIIKEHWIDYDHVYSIAVHDADQFLTLNTPPVGLGKMGGET